MKLIYETHATTVDNENGVATGWLPGELSARGRDEARELGRRRSDVDVVFSSDLRRAVQTVELAGLAAPHFQDWRLRECDYGEFNGVSRDRRVPPVQHVARPFPGGQSYNDVVELTRSFLADVKRWHDGRVVLVVAHSANRWALEHLLGSGRPMDELIVAPFNWRPGWEYEL